MEHGDLGHPADHLYNTTTSVPLIMYIPGIKQKKIDDLVQSIDILPTVLDLTGLKSPKNHFDGIDITDSILGHWQFKLNDYLISEGSNDSIRNNRWKLYVNYNDGPNNTYELYDLYKDPLEKNNLAQKEPQIVKSLHVNLNKIIYKR
jgi:arylsulfatase A-like enzyme